MLFRVMLQFLLQIYSHVNIFRGEIDECMKSFELYCAILFLHKLSLLYCRRLRPLPHQKTLKERVGRLGRLLC